jgi:hypothetical protein
VKQSWWNPEILEGESTGGFAEDALAVSMATRGVAA